MDTRDLDRIDRHILRVLQADSTLPIQQVGERVGLSHNACWRRIKRLEEAGVITLKEGTEETASIFDVEENRLELEFVELDLGEMHRLMLDIAERGDRDFRLRGRLIAAIGPRPDRKRQLAALDLARAVVASRMESTTRDAIPVLSEAHAELVRLAAQAPTYNFDAGLLVLEIGTLLASLAAPSERPHA